MRYALPLDLQLFAEDVPEPTGVENAPAAEGQESQEGNESGVESQAAAEPNNNFEKAFAKRLAAEREKWESDKNAELSKLQDQYKDFDTYKKATDYLMKSNNISDPMTLREQLELAELQERADTQNVSPEMLKRIDELEAKAAKAEEYEKQQEQAKQMSEFEGKLKEFCKDKGVDHAELWNFMHENSIGNPEMALRAMRFEDVEEKRSEIEKEAVKKFLEAKGSMPTVEGKTNGGTPTKEPPKTLKDALSRASQRLANWGNMEG